MAKSVNKAILIGRLGKEPEMRYTGSGMAVCNFSLATNRWAKDQSGAGHEETDWHTIVAWDKLAEICNQYLRKGSLVYIEGSLQTRSWTDTDGKKQYRTEVIAREMTMLDPAPGDGRAARVTPDAEVSDNDIPF